MAGPPWPAATSHACPPPAERGLSLLFILASAGAFGYLCAAT